MNTATLARPITHRIVRFKSKSNLEEVHHTEQTADGHYFCSCKGYEYRRTCRHVEQAAATWKK